MRQRSLIVTAAVRMACAVVAALSVVSARAAQEPAECFVFSRLGDSKPFVSNAGECDRKTAPASTFKIPHALIALQTGAITGDTVFPWDGKANDFAAWRRHHTVDSAIKWSVLPFFQRTAGLIGPDRMRSELSSLGYAADTFERDVSAFWINGDLVVSPLEQLAFLQRFMAGTLPVEPRHVSAVKAALRMPPGQVVNAAGAQPFTLTWPSPAVYAKTGNTSVDGERVSWLVGSLQSDGGDYVFVARVRSSAALERTAGIALAERALNAQKRR